ncbi:MAG TPA: AIM24 family protein, partial [Aggregatilineales bacterium]|nr:AIM24 family protein [Aggregatilineales bacterium]
MKYEVKHTIMQSLEVQLAQGESVYTQSGGMAWMSDGIEMSTGGKGGMMGALGRMMAGSSLLLTTYKCAAPQGMVTFVTDAPGKILPFELAAGQSLIAHRDTFLVATEGVGLEATFTKKLGAGMFGGEGFVLQKITGPGLFWGEISGEVQDYTLAAGQTL